MRRIGTAQHRLKQGGCESPPAPTGGARLALGSEAGGGGGVRGEGAVPTALTGIYWGFCGNVCSGTTKTICCHGTQCLPYQAESLLGEQSQVPGVVKYRGLPRARPWGNQQPPPVGQGS